jgi:hypothetical protein
MPCFLLFAALRHPNRHLLDDFQPEPFQRWNVHGRVRQQTDAVNAQVGQNLSAQPDGA